MNIGDEKIADPTKEAAKTITNAFLHLQRRLKTSSLSKYFFIILFL
jgi:hypothetical protein